MDIHMPGMDGYSCSNLLRDSGIKLPIIIVTANALYTERSRRNTSGIADFVLKPIRIHDIQIIISKYKT
jgi:CheY-like chemotaxis protein